MLINSLASPLSCDLKLINGKSSNKSKTKTHEAELSEFWKAKFGKTYEEIARLIGVTPSYIYNRVQLLSLSPDIIRALQTGSIDTICAHLVVEYYSSIL
jgi:hypothetical protein